MNLNEVKKHVKFDIIFTLLVCIGVATCLLLTLAYIFRPINAAALTETTVTSQVHPGSLCVSQSSTGYCRLSTSSQGDQGIVSYFGSTYSDGIYQINFKINDSLAGSTRYTVRLNFNSNSIPSSNLACTGGGFSCSLAYVSSSQLNLNFTLGNSPISNPEFSIYIPNGTGANYINGSNNLTLNSVILYANALDNSNGSDDIINSGIENTQSIINNDNANTNKIVSSQYDNALNIIKALQFQLEYCSRNLMLGNWVLSTSNMWQLGNDFQQQTADSAAINFRLNAYNNDTYVATLDYANNITTTGRKTFRFYKNSEFNRIDFKLNGATVDTGVFINVSELPDNAYYYISANFTNVTQGSVEWRDMMISAYDSYFVPWGSQQCHDNKLDALNNSIQGGFSDINITQEEMKDIQQDTYNYLTDNSDPTVNTTGISNVLSSVEVSDPLNYLLTLPISLLQKLNAVLSSNTCSRVSFGELYNTELYLPCINFENILGSTIWGTIDLIVGVGLLAIILKRFYDSISNILTLGKEKEVRDKLDLPTPMQFLASILGGGRD